MGYDVSYSNIKNDIPEDTSKVIFEAMKIYYTVRYVMKLNSKKIPDEILLIYSLYLAILRTDNHIRRHLNNMQVCYEDLAEFIQIKNIDQVVLEDKDYKYIYNRFFHYLTIKMYTFSQYQNESMDFEDFALEYVFGYLHHDDFIPGEVMENIISCVYNIDVYDELYEFAFNMLKDLADKQYYNVPNTNLTHLLCQSEDAMPYYDVKKGEKVPPALQFKKKKNGDN